MTTPKYTTKLINNDSEEFYFSTGDSFESLELANYTPDAVLKPNYFSPFLQDFFSGMKNNNGTVELTTREGFERHPFYFYVPEESSYISNGTSFFRYSKDESIKILREKLIYSKEDDKKDINSHNTKMETYIILPKKQINNFLRVDCSSILFEGNPASENEGIKYDDPTSNSKTPKAMFFASYYS